jgi:predicted CXXCH cytochrome family protein
MALRRVLLSGALLLVIVPARAGESRTPQPVIEPARAGTQCLADPATMRREHPAMLEHQRDQTVHGGIRGAKASLKACIACHASPTTGSVAKSETNFCISCHSYTAVRIDCFGCHATQPQPTAFHPFIPSGAQGAAAVRLAAQALPRGAAGAASDGAAVSRLP